MEKSTLQRLASKAVRDIKKNTSKGEFQTLFEMYIKERKMFFEHFSPLDFYYFFFYCYFMWSKGTVLSQEELDELMNEVYVAKIMDTNFFDIETTCPNCEGDGEEECINCGGDGTVDCPECDGSGEDEEGEPCRVCDGDGTVPCSLCDGEGSFTCDDCNGSGEVEDEYNVGFSYFLYFSTNSQEKDALMLSYEEDKPLEDNYISDNLETLGPRGDDEMSFGDTQEYETSSYYVTDLISNPLEVGKLIKVWFYNRR